MRVGLFVDSTLKFPRPDEVSNMAPETEAVCQRGILRWVQILSVAVHNALSGCRFLDIYARPQSSPRSLRNLGREFAGVAGQDIQETSVAGTIWRPGSEGQPDTSENAHGADMVARTWRRESYKENWRNGLIQLRQQK